ncbi:MAG: type II toxin-antitoxin system HicA family toxin [Prosthecobacter sp.]|nr:type II toxin-antitoxin system HicA family toxin [Prosthecobacter sp.]
MKANEVIKLLKADGWQNTSSKGSHLHFTHASKPGKVTVPQHGSHDLAKGTLHSIFKQAGWK